MRINVDIDNDLMKSALAASGEKTQKDEIEAGLNLLIKFNLQSRTKKYRGKLKWSGNLNEMRVGCCS